MSDTDDSSNRQVVLSNDIVREVNALINQVESLKSDLRVVLLHTVNLSQHIKHSNATDTEDTESINIPVDSDNDVNEEENCGSEDVDVK